MDSFKRQRKRLSNRRSIWCDERGTTAIELLGYFPIVMLILVFVWQILLVGYTGIIATGAAREGVRAATTRENVEQAVRYASPGFDGRRGWMALAGYPCLNGQQRVTIQVELETPHVLFPFVDALNFYPRVVQQATARCEPPPGNQSLPLPDEEPQIERCRGLIDEETGRCLCERWDSTDIHCPEGDRP